MRFEFKRKKSTRFANILVKKNGRIKARNGLIEVFRQHVFKNKRHQVLMPILKL